MSETPKESSHKILIMPDKVFSERIKSSINPNASNDEINRIVNPFRIECQNLCGSIEYSTDSPGRILVFEKNNLRIFKGLGIISNEESTKLKEIESQFDQTVQEIISIVGGNPVEVEKNIDLTLGFGSSAASNLLESKEILTNGPIVRGFEETDDPQIPNIKVLQFVRNSFGIESLTKAKVGGITKNDKYLFYSTTDKIEIRKKILQSGIAEMMGSNTLLADNKENYLKGAILLEEVNNIEALKHIYKLRASSGDQSCFSIFFLHSIGIEKSSDFDYLEGTSLKTEEDKMRVYLLSTIAHEILHRYHSLIDKDALTEYQNIVQQEISSKRKHFVSDYVIKHQEIYGNNEVGIAEEDMAESVRIYVANSSYLKNNYPLRLAFIEKHLPFIQKDTAVKAITDQ